MQQVAQAEISQLVTVRPAKEDDLGFVLSSWSIAAYKHIESSLFLSEHAKKPNWIVWKKLFPQVQQTILSRAMVYVLTPADVPEQILSFAIVEVLNDGTPVLHWCATKKKLWRKGMAEYLLRHLGFDPDKSAVYTWAGSAYNVVKQRIANWNYVPFWLFAPKPQG